MKTKESIKSKKSYLNIRLKTDIATQFKMMCLALGVLPNHKLDQVVADWIKQESKKTKISITM